MTMATIDTSIVIIAMPAIFRGIHLDPAAPGNISYLLWMIIGYLLLTAWDWRAVSWVNVPSGVFGTVWSYLKLREIATVKRAAVDWWGNITFAAGAGLLLVAITYGIQPYGGHPTGWTSPLVLGGLGGGIALLAMFCLIETKIAEPMFQLGLFRIRAFAAGNLASLMSSVARGGLQFMLIIWLQGIWLPLHGYDFAQTPLRAGIYLLPLTAGFLIARPVSGYLSDRYVPRPFATTRLLVSAAAFARLPLLPGDFPYWL